MSGHRPFSELTKEFTAERWQRVTKTRVELDEVSSFYVPPDDKARIRKMIVSSVARYRKGHLSRHLMPSSLPTKQYMFAPREQAANAIVTQGIALYKSHEVKDSLAGVSVYHQ